MKTVRKTTRAPVTTRSWKDRHDGERWSARRRFLRLAGLGLGTATVLTGIGSTAFAEERWPTRAIRMIVPFPPGGVADTVGRPVAESLSRTLGQPVVVENRPGAGGGVGMAAASKAEPDGYTILMALSSIAILPAADKVLGRPPMYEIGKLVPIARFTADPTVLAVRADSPWKTYADFIAHVREKPDSVSFGSSGNYGTMHVPMEMLKQSTGTRMLHVPYGGGGPAVVGLLGGQVDALSTGPATVLAHVKSGRVRVLAHWGTGRLSALPDVPSLTELGVPVQFAQWSGLFAPAGVPDAVLGRLAKAAAMAATDPAVVRAIGTAGTPIQYLDRKAFATYVDSEVKTMAKAVEGIGKVE
ncbi:MAG: Bug family tripartite tricarboxylate transporter substrate binding protein [Lautropia sp.]